MLHSQPASCCVDREAFARRLLTDRFDAAALNYAAYDERGDVIGSIRVVPDSPIGLPLEECFPLDGFRAGKRLAELCRLAVASDGRGTRLPLLLMKAGWQGARRLRATHVLVDTYVGQQQRTHTTYRKLGFEQIGAYADTRYVLNDPSLVMSVECESGEEALPPHLRTFFRSPDPLIDHGA